MFTPIQELLPRAISKFGVKSEVDAAVVCEKYRKIAHLVIHPEVLEHTYPKTFRGKVLTIGTESPAWAQVILEKKEELINRLNIELGAKYIHSIRTAIVEKNKILADT